MVFFVKVIGHELVTQTDENKQEFDMLKITMRGTGDDKKTRVQVLVDPPEVGTFPLGEHGEIAFRIPQQRLDLAPKSQG